MTVGGFRFAGNKWSAERDNSGTILVNPMSESKTRRASTVVFSLKRNREPGMGYLDGSVVKSPTRALFARLLSERQEELGRAEMSV